MTSNRVTVFGGSGFLGRQFLKGHRPLTLHIVDEHNEPLLVASRSFFFFSCCLSFGLTLLVLFEDLFDIFVLKDHKP